MHCLNIILQGEFLLTAHKKARQKLIVLVWIPETKEPQTVQKVGPRRGEGGETERRHGRGSVIRSFILCL